MNLTATTDSAPETEAEPKRRRPWWLIIPFLILAALIVLGVVTLGKPPIHPYDFMAKARLVSSDELLLTDSLGRTTYHGEYYYEIDYPKKDFSSHASDELFFLGWSTDIGRRQSTGSGEEEGRLGPFATV